MSLSIDKIIGRRKQKVIRPNDAGWAALTINSDTDYFDEVVVLSSSAVTGLAINVNSFNQRNFNIIIPSMKYTGTNPLSGTICLFKFNQTEYIKPRDLYFNRRYGQYSLQVFGSNLFYKNNTTENVLQADFYFGMSGDNCNKEEMCHSLNVSIGWRYRSVTDANRYRSIYINPNNTNCALGQTSY